MFLQITENYVHWKIEKYGSEVVGEWAERK